MHLKNQSLLLTQGILIVVKTLFFHKEFEKYLQCYAKKHMYSNEKLLEKNVNAQPGWAFS